MAASKYQIENDVDDVFCYRLENRSLMRWYTQNIYLQLIDSIEAYKENVINNKNLHFCQILDYRISN